MSQLAHAPLASPPSPPSGHAKILKLTGELVQATPSISPASLNSEVFATFEAHPHLVGLPVVEDGLPIGLINRNIFMQSLARPFYREVFLGKSCIAFMDKAPLIVEKSLSIQDLSFQVMHAGEKALADGYIITDQGQYLGTGSGLDMVKAIATLQAEKNRQVMESIDYASVIQKSLGRASRDSLRAHLPNHFLLWEPRDIVSGDYFHFQAFEGGFFAALFDCTGHGVPGAFMTMIMSSFLQNALASGNWRDPAALLAQVNQGVKHALGQIDHTHSEHAEESENASDDGMDAAFCAFDSHTRTLTFAGAHAPLFLLPAEAEDIEIIEGNRAGVGYAATPLDQAWQNHSLTLPEKTACYFFTDGIFDQLGGERRIAFGKKRLVSIIKAHRHADMAEQRAAIYDALMTYQGREVRKDDVSGLGFVL